MLVFQVPPGTLYSRIPKPIGTWIIGTGGYFYNKLWFARGCFWFYTPQSLRACPWKMMVWFGDYFPFGMSYFQGQTVKLPGSKVNLASPCRAFEQCSKPWLIFFNRKWIYPFIIGILRSQFVRIPVDQQVEWNVTRVLNVARMVNLQRSFFSSG